VTQRQRARRDAIRTNCDQDALIPKLLEGPITGGFLRQARVTAKPHDGESLREALLRTRSEIEQAKGELVTVRAAPPPRDVVEQTLHTEVQRPIFAGSPRIAVEGDSVNVCWPDTTLFAGTGQALNALADSASAMIAALFSRSNAGRCCARALSRSQSTVSARTNARVASPSSNAKFCGLSARRKRPSLPCQTRLFYRRRRLFARRLA
jgi:hypothetical protein